MEIHNSRVVRISLVILLTGLYLFLSLVVLDIVIPWLRLVFLWDGWVTDGVMTYDPPFWFGEYVFIISLFLLLVGFVTLVILRLSGYRLNIRKNFLPSLIVTCGFMLLLGVSMMFVFPLFEYRFESEMHLALRTCRIHVLWSTTLLVGSVILQIISRRRNKNAQTGYDKPQALQYAFGSLLCSVIAALLLLLGFLLPAHGFSLLLIFCSLIATVIAVCIAIPALVSKSIPGKLKSTVVIVVSMLVLSMIIVLLVAFYYEYSGLFLEQ